MSVMTLLPEAAPDDAKFAALLHDVIEDTDVTFGELKMLRYSEETLKIISLVTRSSEEDRPTYMDWIRSIVASGNLWAMWVKYADNLHNSDPERIAALPEDQRDIVKRYERSKKILREAINNYKVC